MTHNITELKMLGEKVDKKQKRSSPNSVQYSKEKNGFCSHRIKWRS